MPNNSEQAALTSFVNEACDQVSVRGMHSARPPEMYKDVAQVTNLSDYFSRPYVIARGNVNSSSQDGIFTAMVTNKWIQEHTYNFSRVLGAFGWRATLVFRLQVIATPFQAGVLRLVFSPFEDDIPTNHRRTAHIAAVSQLPGVELDVTESTSAILRVPFIHPLNYFPVKKPTTTLPEDNLGTVSLWTYVGPNNATGDLTSYVLWFSLEDFELIGAAPGATVAQPGTFVAQSGFNATKTRKSASSAPSSKEAEAVPGSLSNVLAAGSNLATWLGKIPMLSEIAGPASWFLRQSSNIAASFGWARPLTSSTINKVWHTQNNYQMNCDGVDVSHSLGLFSENTVTCMPGFAGSNVDEMSLDFIKGIYACVYRGTITPTQAHGFCVVSAILSPSAMKFSTGDARITPFIGTIPNVNSGKAFWPAPAFAIGQCFKYWRGGFKFRIKMSKTKFHTGRVILGFVPNAAPFTGGVAQLPADLDQLQYVSKVWDLREGNTMEFECPFISNRSYLQFGESYGSFFLSIIEDMQAPPSVSQTIEFVVEVACMDDFEFMQPTEIIYPAAPVDTFYVAQSGIPTDQVPKDFPAHVCAGEQVNSVKQLLARAANVYTTGPIVNVNVHTVGLKHGLSLWAPDELTPTSLTNAKYDYLSYFQNFFGLQRGGYSVDTFYTGPGGILTGSIIERGNQINVTPHYSDTGALHVKVPYYSPTSRTIIGAPYLPQPPECTVSISQPTDKTYGTWSIYRHAADDYQLGYFLGTPPLAVPFTTTTPGGSLLYTSLTTPREVIP